MCAFDSVTRTYHADEPIKCYKFFTKVKDDSVGFVIVKGRVPRGKWLRHDEVVTKGSRCATWQPGFHAFTEPHWSEDPTDEMVPVKLKGEITVAVQHGVEIVVGEWMYVPTALELLQERFGPVDSNSQQEDYVEVAA